MLTFSIKSLSPLGAVLAVMSLTQTATAAAPDQIIAQSVGEFEGQGDIGNPKLSGSASYANHRYTLIAGGANVFGAHDEFHFAWRKVQGDFSIRARVTFDGPGVEAHRKGGVMARAGLDDASAYVDATVHGNGPNAMQLRTKEGGDTQMLVAAAPVTGGPAPMNPAPKGESASPASSPPPKLVELTRHGNRFTVTIIEPGKPPQVRDTTVDLPATLYVGVYLCAHDPDVREQASFARVRVVAHKPN